MTAGTWTCPLEPSGNGLCYPCAASPGRRCDGAMQGKPILASEPSAGAVSPPR